MSWPQPFFIEIEHRWTLPSAPADRHGQQSGASYGMSPPTLPPQTAASSRHTLPPCRRHRENGGATQYIGFLIIEHTK